MGYRDRDLEMLKNRTLIEIKHVSNGRYAQAG